MKKFTNIQVIVVVLITSLFTNNSIAQDSTRTLIISGVPQYIINHGLRIDIEKRLPNIRQWLIISPQFYMGWVDRNRTDFNSSKPGTDGDSLFGFGMNLTHKIFLIDRTKPVGGYFSYGVTYQRFSLGYSEYDWVPYDEFGQTYYEYKLADFTDIINKFGLNTCIGIQGILVDYIVYDIYIGLGARYSHIKSGMPGAREYNQYYWDYAYSGPLLLLGARIGVLLF